MVARRADLFAALGGSALLHLVVLLGIPISSTSHHAATRTTPAITLSAHLQSAQDHATPSRTIARPLVDHSVVEQPTEFTATVVTALATPPEIITNEAGYYATDQLDSPPRLLGEVQQIYPSRARTAEIEGFVSLALLINERGEVDDISITNEAPQGYFEEAALTMLRQQRFTPALKQNRAVKSRWLTTVRYRLQGALKDSKS